MNDSKERLKRLENLLESKERKGNRLCWLRWNPNSNYGYEIDDAREDIQWMLYEIKRLLAENSELRAFVDEYRNRIKNELDSS